MTFRLNEAYAQAGLGAFDEAAAIVSELAALPQPPNLQCRQKLLARLFELIRDDAAGRQLDRVVLAATMRRLRELQWVGALTWLPRPLSRLWAMALERRIESEWIRASIWVRRLDPPEPSWPNDWPWAVRLQVLGPFEWTGEAVPGETSVRPRHTAGKAAVRPLELLRRLAECGGFGSLPAASLAKAMWPGDGRVGQAKALEITLSRLRKLIGCADGVLLQGQQLRLNPSLVWLDRVALERVLHRLADPTIDDSTRASLWHEALRLWRGPVLADMPENDWVVAARDALRRRMAAALLSSTDDPAQRSRCLRAVAADPGLAPWLRSMAG